MVLTMYPKSFKRLIDHFASLPSVGPKMAERLVLYLFKQDSEKLQEFAKSLSNLKTDLRYCQRCFNISEETLCGICRDSARNQKIICVVEDPIDIIAIEKTKRYTGAYHVLGGLLSPGEKNQTQIRFNELLDRIENISEVIIATNPTTEGDATALYIQRLLRETTIKVTRLARGLSTGADLEHADEITLGSAILNRK